MAAKYGIFELYPLASTLIATLDDCNLFLCEPSRLKTVTKDGEETVREATPSERKARATFKMVESSDSNAYGAARITPDRMVALGRMFTERGLCAVQNGAGKPAEIAKIAVGVATARTKARFGETAAKLTFKAGDVEMADYTC